MYGCSFRYGQRRELAPLGFFLANHLVIIHPVLIEYPHECYSSLS